VRPLQAGGLSPLSVCPGLQVAVSKYDSLLLPFSLCCPCKHSGPLSFDSSTRPYNQAGIVIRVRVASQMQPAILLPSFRALALQTGAVRLLTTVESLRTTLVSLGSRVQVTLSPSMCIPEVVGGGLDRAPSNFKNSRLWSFDCADGQLWSPPKKNCCRCRNPLFCNSLVHQFR
jgi:hypothetical protein